MTFFNYKKKMAEHDPSEYLPERQAIPQAQARPAESLPQDGVAGPVRDGDSIGESVREPVPEPVSETVDVPAGRHATVGRMASDRLRVARQAGWFRLDLPDGRSESGYGSLFLRQDAVHGAVNPDGTPVAGFVDVDLDMSSDAANPYFIVENGRFVGAACDFGSFLDEQDTLSRKRSQDMRESVLAKADGVAGPRSDEGFSRAD